MIELLLIIAGLWFLALMFSIAVVAVLEVARWLLWQLGLTRILK